MERYLENFHRHWHKEVFARFCAKKLTKQSASVLRHELPEELRTEREKSSDWNRLSDTVKARRIEDDREMIVPEVEQHLTDESDFNFVKMHLPCHFGKSIRQLGHQLNLTSEYYEHEMIDIKDAYRHSNKINATEQILRTKAQREFFRYKNMECEAQLTRLDDGTIPNPLLPTCHLRGQKTDIKTHSQLAKWCILPTGTLQNQIAWYLKQFDILPAYAQSDEAFSRLSDLKYTRYTAAVFPVANFQSEDVDQHIVMCAGQDPS